MSIKYKPVTESLGTLIHRATHDAIYVIPDLQRPFVWTPRRVTLLVDSLFRGWPFGTLLLWEVQTSAFDDHDEGIPHRPFWRVVDRADNSTGEQASALQAPATYRMVLDGQQRIQSLVIALGGDDWGFCLREDEWALDLQEKRIRRTDHWSRGGLCLDLEKFESQLEQRGGRVRSIDLGEALDWVVLEPSHQSLMSQKTAATATRLQTARDKPGRFIRLSRIWSRVQTGLADSEYEEFAQALFHEYAVRPDRQEKLRLPMAQFMGLIDNIKNNTDVHGLMIEPLRVSPQWTKDDYSNAIVTIFTRLNSAGRELTREEITYAWLKRGWRTANTDNKRADQCLADLQGDFEKCALEVDDDGLIRLISFIWAVEHRSEGKLLDDKDLLKGHVIGPMAKSISSEWMPMRQRLQSAAKLLHSRDLAPEVGSFNTVTVFMTLCVMLYTRRDAFQLRVVERDRLDKELDRILGQFTDRWVFATQWAATWGERTPATLQNFATMLKKYLAEVTIATSETLPGIAQQITESLLAEVLSPAIAHVTLTSVEDRKRVYLYRSLLWVWHRLDRVRWGFSEIALRLKRAQARWEVDHTVADGWWSRAVEERREAALQGFAGSDSDRANVAPVGFESVRDALGFINSVGNCSLLEKSFNISKGMESFWSFLSRVDEFSRGTVSRDAWETAMLFSPCLTDPTSTADGFTSIVSAVRSRERAMKDEVIEFLQGTRSRQDLVT